MAMKGELHILRATVVDRDIDQLAQIVFVTVRRRARRSARAERHCEGNLIPLQRRMRLPPTGPSSYFTSNLKSLLSGRSVIFIV